MTKPVRFALIAAAILSLASAPVFAQSATPGPTPTGSVGVQLPVERADAANTVQHSHSTGATITLTAGAAGTATQYVYITGIDISNCQGAAAVTPAMRQQMQDLLDDAATPH